MASGEDWMIAKLRGQRSRLQKPRAAVEGGRGQFFFVSVCPAPLAVARFLSSGMPCRQNGKAQQNSNECASLRSKCLPT